MWTIFSFFWENATLFSYVWHRVCVTATHTLQFSSWTVPFNFVWLSHSALIFSGTTNLLVYFYVIHQMLCGLSHLFASFSECNSPNFLCQCHANILCVPIILMWMSLVYLRFLCVNFTQIFLRLITSEWKLHFASFWVLNKHSRSYLAWNATYHFLSENSFCPPTFLIVGNVANLFMTTFPISNVITYW